MGDFDEAVRKAQRAADEAAAWQQQQEARERSDRAAFKDHLRKVLRVATAMAPVLTVRGVPHDVELLESRLEEVKVGWRKKEYRWPEFPVLSGWSIGQRVNRYSNDNGMQGANYSVYGVLLSAKGEVVGYRSAVPAYEAFAAEIVQSWTIDRDGNPYCPVWRWTLDPAFGDGERRRLQSIAQLPFVRMMESDASSGYFTVAEVEEGLAKLAVTHKVDPASLGI